MFKKIYKIGEVGSFGGVSIRYGREIPVSEQSDYGLSAIISEHLDVHAPNAVRESAASEWRRRYPKKQPNEMKSWARYTHEKVWGI